MLVGPQQRIPAKYVMEKSRPYPHVFTPKLVALVDALAREDLCLEAFELIRIQLMKMLDASGIDLHYGATV